MTRIIAHNQSGTFNKAIQQSDTGMVIASVFDESGQRVGLKMFTWPPFDRNQHKRLERAHSWADKWIENCERYVNSHVVEQT